MPEEAVGLHIQVLGIEESKEDETLTEVDKSSEVVAE